MLVLQSSVSCFCSGINVIKNLALLARVIACLMIAFAPVRIFDDYLYIRVHLFCGPDYKVTRNFHHLSQTEFRPRAVSFFAYTIFAHTLCKEKVVDNKFVKHSGSIFRNFFCKLAHRFIAVTQSTKKTLAFFVRLILVRADCCNST